MQPLQQQPLSSHLWTKARTLRRNGSASLSRTSIYNPTFFIQRFQIPYETTNRSVNNAPQTLYMRMSIESNLAQKRYTISASAFSWLILAGYLVLPNTFTSLNTSSTLTSSRGGHFLQTTVRNIQLLPLASVLCFIGTAGICWLWYKWRKNYVWLITYIFV